LTLGYYRYWNNWVMHAKKIPEAKKSILLKSRLFFEFMAVHVRNYWSPFYMGTRACAFIIHKRNFCELHRQWRKYTHFDALNFEYQISFKIRKLASAVVVLCAFSAFGCNAMNFLRPTNFPRSINCLGLGASKSGRRAVCEHVHCLILEYPRYSREI
jgi:hypothetical protein